MAFSGTQGRRAARASAVAVRGPAYARRKPRTLQETLIGAGVVPRRHRFRPHGLLRRWFAAELFALAVLNAAASVALLALAITMTVTGMRIIVALDLAATMYVALNAALPYAGVALVTGGLLKVLQTAITHRNDRFGKLLGAGTALLLIAGGVWLEVMLGYASFVPWMFRPIVSIAGGDAAARIDEANRALVAYFEPVFAASIGLLLAAKQMKSVMHAGQHRARGYFVIIGLTASTGALLIGLYAAHRHYVSHGASDSGLYAIGGDYFAGDRHTYGPLFAPGVRCRVSDLYGMRADPLNTARLEDHRGVDLAVKYGTPIRAMAAGQVIYAASDAGLGKLVALQVAGPHQPVLLAGHMSRFAVKPGDIVGRGDIIGFAGSTGRSTGPHVHLQVCPDAHLHRGALACGQSENPYEVWPALAALARMSCNDGPIIY